MTNSIAVFTIIFFILFGFIGILRKPLTCIASFFITYNILSVMIPEIESVLALALISIFIALVLAVLVFKTRMIANFLFGFCLTYFSFLQFASIAEIFTSSNDTTFLMKLFSNDLFINTNYLLLITSSVIGLICIFLNKKFVEGLASFVSTFMIMIYLIDISRGVVSPSIEFKDIFTNLFNVVDNVINQNANIVLNYITNPNFLSIYISLPITILVCGVTVFIKRNKYEFL